MMSEYSSLDKFAIIEGNRCGIYYEKFSFMQQFFVSYHLVLQRKVADNGAE
jgi:hypothetical protein